MTGLARTRLTPNMLTAAGVTLSRSARCSSTSSTGTRCCSSGPARSRSSSGSVLDILDGALARAGGKQTPFGGFLDSTLDRVGEGLMLGSIALVFMRDGQELALAFAVAAIGGSSSSLRPRQGGGPRDQGRRRHRLPRRARRRDLGRTDPRTVGCPAVGDRRSRGDRVVHRAAADPARAPPASRALGHAS